MSTPNLTKSVLSSSPSEEKTEDPSQTVLKHARFYEVLRTNATNGIQEMHQNRIKSLRKELDFIKETKWKFEPIDKYIGQASQ